MNSQNFEQLMNLYGGIKTGCGIAAVVFLIAAIALFFLLKIPGVFSELTGRGAKKAIEEMTAENSSGGLSLSRKIGDDGRRHKKVRSGVLGTTKLRKNTSRLTGQLICENSGTDSTLPDQDSDRTGVMNSGSGETGIMTGENNETSVLGSGSGETTVMNSGAGETSVMNSGSETRNLFVIERSIVEIHTNEVI